MRKYGLLLVPALLLSAACRPSSDRADAEASGAVATGGAPTSRGGGDPVAKGAEKATPETLPENLVIAPEELDAADAATNLPSNGTAPAKITHIPDTFWGRWALVPADCEPGRSDAKGLLRIDDNRLYFYESRATLDRIISATQTRFEASYGFSGEGMSWDAVQVLELKGGKLRRTATGEQPVDLTYGRCP